MFLFLNCRNVRTWLRARRCPWRQPKITMQGIARENWPFQFRLKDGGTLITSICPRLTPATTIPNEHATLWKYSSYSPGTATASFSFSPPPACWWKRISNKFSSCVSSEKHNFSTIGRFRYLSRPAMPRQSSCPVSRFFGGGMRVKMTKDGSFASCEFSITPQNKSYFIVERGKAQKKSFTCRLVTNSNLSFLSFHPGGIRGAKILSLRIDLNRSNIISVSWDKKFTQQRTWWTFYRLGQFRFIKA